MRVSINDFKSRYGLLPPGVFIKTAERATPEHEALKFGGRESDKVVVSVRVV